ncbi:flagellar basal body-associated FliL family protein [Salisediminibacterium selenitireducens]|uniref:Flagellar protein FliL n=1 Tax=Bacillus selenitireducens (strain ATCC 700615 / DSM 15326 / MLS10) TaxID=439292 RepID=D6XUM7_BACIE|nr:flagellar basal body-associated FliL family protein [Salisediminibacterium selenitireducens]ADH99513.1 flagellar basal body-associated protein FliL [[Bacillus] selenitireducens MLS10]
MAESDEQAEKKGSDKGKKKTRVWTIVVPITAVTIVAGLFFIFFGGENFLASDDVRDRTYSTEERIYMMGDGNIARGTFAIELSDPRDRQSLINGRKVIDWIISNAISDFDLSSISGKSGREALEARIEDGIREQFPSMHVEKVYITSFVIS